MLISQHLREEAIDLDLKGSTVLEALDQLASLVSKPYGRVNSEHIREQLIQREKLLSTASGCGLAFPHCYLDVSKPGFALGVCRNGIDADAPDNKPVHIFLVVVSPENDPNAHLEALSAASKIFLDEKTRTRVSSAREPVEVLQIIQEAEKEN